MPLPFIILARLRMFKMAETTQQPEREFELRLSNLEIDVRAIIDRNSKVEAEKAWETSTVRRSSILLITYVLMAILFLTIGADRPYVNALIPTLGYFLSTLYLGKLKAAWIKNLLGTKN